MASETVDPIEWSHPPPDTGQYPLSSTYCTLQCGLQITRLAALSQPRTCDFRMPDQRTAGAATQGPFITSSTDHIFQQVLLFTLFWVWSNCYEPSNNNIIIIYHDFSLHQGGVVMSSQITHTQSSNMHPLAHTLDICALIFSSLPQPHVMWLHSTSLQMITTKAREGGPEKHWANQKWPRETHSVTYVPGLSTLSDLSRIDALPPPSFLCCPRPPSHHPSSLTSVYNVPGLHLLPQSTPFWPYGTHLFFPPLKPSQYSLILTTR